MNNEQIAAGLSSSSESAREAAFLELKRQMEDSDLRENAIELLLTSFRLYIEQRSVAAMQTVTRTTFSADDIIQMVFWKLSKRLREGKVELLSLAQFKVFLRTMTQRIATDQMRRKPKPSGGINNADEEGRDLEIAGLWQTASMVARNHELENAIRTRLSDEDWRLLQLRVTENCDWEQIATEMFPNDDQEERRRRSDALRIRLSRILKKLSKDLVGFQSTDHPPDIA